MKKCLYILLVINILSIICAFFITLSTSIITALIILGLGILQLVPTVALIFCLDSIEEQNYKISQLYFKLYHLQEINESETTDNPPIAEIGKKSTLPWKCIKCETVNKAGATNCSNCGAKFLPEINPVFEPTPKGLKGFLIKFKK